MQRKGSTTTTANADQIQFTGYNKGRFAEHLPFGRTASLFAVPGSFPEDTPAHTNVTDMEMAVYRKHGEWEARDVNGDRNVWGVGPTRREAAGLSFHAIARKRRYRAADMANMRHACGLETVPPYAVEVTDSVTLVLFSQAIAHLVRIEATDFGHPANYHVTDPRRGGAYVIPAGAGGELRTLKVGVLYIRCAHDVDVDYFEHETEALDHVREEMAVWEVCPQSPGAPADGDQGDDGQGDDLVEGALDSMRADRIGEAERARCASLTATATAAYAAHVVRKSMPAAAALTIDVTNGNLRAVLDAERRTLWYAPASPTGLPEDAVEDIEDAMRDALSFGADETALEQAGWTNPGAYDDTYDLTLPEPQQ
ncbi:MULTISPECIES: hypothetical protein [Streptomyces]|uniref:PE-PGRS family protein n=1 Tax=Streptomyces glycanivorans TaxID=3033808 RepID=A0ABY9JT76_9ACTN|nr:hypothetical protein [Streptomyces sp. Alt3]WLQ69211.1 hypothetical protein P8A20_37365 [Streptomyces sp. Alt3]